VSRLAVLVAVLALQVAATAAGAGTTAYVTIRHQDAGCHTWSLDGGPFRAALAVSLKAGATITFTNDDVMALRLVEVSGPRLVLPPPMGRSTFHSPGGGTVVVRFPRSGTYRLRAVDAGDDEVATTGAENVLSFVVRVH